MHTLCVTAGTICFSNPPRRRVFGQALLRKRYDANGVPAPCRPLGCAAPDQPAQPMVSPSPALKDMAVSPRAAAAATSTTSST